jgi:uncharacterized protein YkwD
MTGKALRSCLLIFLWAPSLWASLNRIDRLSYRSQEPGPAALERRLFELANEERQKSGLRPLHFSPELAAGARRHSGDMAGRHVLSHVGSTGESFDDRLVAAGLYFSGGGENVARSFSATAEQIHASLMQSPEHRKNILGPDFDTIGVGAVMNAEAVFFVTDDFLERLVVLDRETSRERAGATIQEIRRARGLPPLIWDKKADALALEMSQARAAGRKLPGIPPSFGEVRALFVISPKMEDLAKRAAAIGSPDCREGGLGVAFNRTRENPGGAFFITLVLLPVPRGSFN